MARKPKTEPKAETHADPDGKHQYNWLVELLGDNGNKKSCSIGVVIRRDQFGDDLNVVTALLLNARMMVTLQLVAEDGQTPSLIVENINESCETHGISIKDQDSIGIKLTFERTEELRHQLVKFGYSKARMAFKRTGNAGEDPAGKAAVVGEEDDGPEDTSGDLYDDDGVLIRKGPRDSAA
jgi:hypothetical protein